jgi:hypothetical protein
LQELNQNHKNMNIQVSTNNKTNDGQSIIEFALVLGLIIIIFLGAIDIFNLLQQKANLDRMILQAARQAGEFGGAGDNNEVQTYIRTEMIAMGFPTEKIDEALAPGTLTFTTKAYDGDTIGDADTTGLQPGECKYGQLITVSTAVEWNTNIPKVLFFNGFNGAGTFRVQSTARCWRAL